jgi:hypothetical protein
VLADVLEDTVGVVDGEGRAAELPADAVVLAPHLAARTDLVARFADAAPEVHVVGDCREPRVLLNAVHEAFEAALEI